MGRTRIAVIGALVATVVVAAACGGGSETKSNSAAMHGLGAGGGATAANAPAQQGLAGGGGVKDAPAATVGGATGNDFAAAAKSAPNELLDSRSLIRTADITVQVKDISAADNVRVIAASAHGDVASDDRALGDRPTASLTIEVPPESLGTVLSRISALGKEKARTVSTRDVTAQVVDVDSRVRSAQASIDQLRVLFRQADKLGDVITLENELTRREANLESLQAQQRTLSAQTSMARVTVNLTTAAPVAPAAVKPAQHKGVGGALWRGWHHFAAAVAATTRGLALIGPFVVALLIVAAGAFLGVRRHRRSLPAPVPDAAT